MKKPRQQVSSSSGWSTTASFHGMSTGGVLIGGGGPLEVKQMLQAAIIGTLNDASISVTIASETDQYGGDSPSNLVNWLTVGGVGGVQIEQGREVRISYSQAVSDAVISVFEQLI
jgi:phage replication-related protein YjqB (UPF0714/DUF867 family)